MERRYFPIEELRVDRQDGGSPVIRGHAAVFDRLSEDLGGWQERIRPGAFTEAIAHDDVRSLWNHNTDLVLGRNKAGTLELVEDAKGLAVRIQPPSWATGQLETIERGDVSQMSFGFSVAKGDDVWKTEGGRNIREVIRVRPLFEVSPVTFPAYRQTDVSVRALFQDVGLDGGALLPALVRFQRGLPPADGDQDLVRAAVDRLREWSAPLAKPTSEYAPAHHRNRALDLLEASLDS